MSDYKTILDYNRMKLKIGEIEIQLGEYKKTPVCFRIAHNIVIKSKHGYIVEV